jgi:hypothetical protein
MLHMDKNVTACLYVRQYWNRESCFLLNSDCAHVYSPSLYNNSHVHGIKCKSSHLHITDCGNPMCHITAVFCTLPGANHLTTWSHLLFLPVYCQESLSETSSGTANVAKRNAVRPKRWKPDWNRTLARPRRRWEDNIRMDLREIWW